MSVKYWPSAPKPSKISDDIFLITTDIQALNIMINELKELKITVENTDVEKGEDEDCIMHLDYKIKIGKENHSMEMKRVIEVVFGNWRSSFFKDIRIPLIFGKFTTVLWYR